MIHYDLRCAKDHVFDAWFRDSAAFDELARQRKLSCPMCGSKKVVKAPMAPRIAKSIAAPEAPTAAAEPEAEMPQTVAAQAGPRMMAMMQGRRQMLEALKQHVEANCDYVGTNFAEEARKIHYGEVEKRGIYGEATEEEATALADEGIEVQALPWPQRSDA